jgi:hypothetical protein
MRMSQQKSSSSTELLLKCGTGTILTLPGLEFRPFCRLSRSQWLYLLRYPSSSIVGGIFDVHSFTVYCSFFLRRFSANFPYFEKIKGPLRDLCLPLQTSERNVK